MNQILELRQGDALLRLAPALGARALRCALEDERGLASDIFHPYPEGHQDLERWARGGLYPLIPYWGRIAQGRLHHGGSTIELQPHPEALPHTLHGTSHRQAWSVGTSATDAATLYLEHSPDAHWPWPYRAELQFRLAPRELRVSLTLQNTGSETMPAGIGLHPYVRRSAGLRLQLQADACWPPTDDYLATARAPLPPADNLAAPQSIDDRARTAFYDGWHGVARVTSEAGGMLEIRASPTLHHLVLHQPEAAPYICIEPVSHVADAFNLAARGVHGTGTRVLAPGESLAGWVSFRR